MNNYHLNENITLYTITASSFPEGVVAAFEELYQHASPEDVSAYYGVSYANKSGEITYKAAMALKESVTNIPKLAIFILCAGEYRGEELLNFRAKIGTIGNTFQELIHQSDLDEHGCCVEMYYNDTDVRCMVRIKDKVEEASKH